MRFVRMYYVSIGLALALILVLVGCSSTQTAKPKTSASSPTATTPIITPTGSPAVGMHTITYTDPTYGFSIDIPGNTQQYGPNYNSTTHISDSEWSETSGTPGHEFAIQTMAYPFPKVNQAEVCHDSTPISISPNITGYQRNHLHPTGNDLAHAAFAGIDIYFFAHGVAVYVTIYDMTLEVPDQQFTKQLETVWQNIVASFVPGKLTLDSYPCGN